MVFGPGGLGGGELGGVDMGRISKSSGGFLLLCFALLALQYRILRQKTGIDDLLGLHS